MSITCFKILLVISCLSFIKCLDLCKNKTRTALAFLDFNNEFASTYYDDFQSRALIKSNFDRTKNSSKLLNHIQPVNSYINTTNDAYIQYMYSDLVLDHENELINKTQNFTLILKLTPMTYTYWNKRNTKLIVKILEVYLDIKEYLSSNGKNETSVFEEKSLNETIRYYLVKFYLQIKFKFNSELDEKVINLVNLIKHALHDYKLNCMKEVLIETAELVNYHDENKFLKNDYNYNFTEKTDSFLSDKLYFYTKIDNKTKINGLKSYYQNEYKFSMRFNSTNHTDLSVLIHFNEEAAVSVANKLECEKNLYKFSVNVDDPFRSQILNSLVKIFPHLAITATEYLACLSSTRTLEENEKMLNLEYERILNEKENQTFFQSIYVADQYLSFIFSIISCLLMPILFQIYLKLKKETFKTLFKENHLIYILLLSLFLAHLITIVDIILYKPVRNSNVCVLLALLKQYIWLTTIFQMSTYAIDLYFKIIQPFSVYSKKPPYKFYLSYFFTFPLVFTAIPFFLFWFAQKTNVYSFHYCFLTGINYSLTCFFLPICAICVANTILMFVYCKRLKQTSSVKSRTASETNMNSRLLNTFIKLSK